ncbi:MAG: L,D-transpeptidase family protein [Myxococcota bacterium]
MRARPLPTAIGAVLGVVVGVGGIAAATSTSGCGEETSPPGPALGDAAGPASDGTTGLAALPTPPPMPEDDPEAPVVEEPAAPSENDEAQAGDEPEKPWEGPWLGALAQATPVYPTARFSKNRMGYVRRGGKVPVIDKPVKTKSCKQGFYPLVDGGYVCGKYATTNIDDPRVKMGVKAPNVDALLPYRYAYNRKHGTPLYVQVPSKEEMLRYEPYLAPEKKPETSEGNKTAATKKKQADDDDAKKHAEEADKPRRDRDDPREGGTVRAADLVENRRRAAAEPSAVASSSPPPVRPVASTAPAPSSGAHASSGDRAAATPSPSATALLPAPGAEGGGGASADGDTPWWQKDSVDVKLSDLDEADGTLRKRMVKGFFIAVDRTFGWNNRMWYKTTDGLIAPADRMIIPKTPELEGLAYTEGMKGVAFVLWRKGYKVHFEGEGDDVEGKRGDRLNRFDAYGLTGNTRLYNKHRYHETVEGWWFKEQHGTLTAPGPRPSEVGADEKWVDVNISRKTLVAFIGDRPVYAALNAPGKKSKIRSKDHRTKKGKWRVREKHVTTTMDGDGPSGDLPYSIQDVPYVQYYDGSYALHGAFWHHNFGAEKSHGCVNLAPKDAKWLFYWTEPSLPRGWHGVWSSDKRRGSMVVVHD